LIDAESQGDSTTTPQVKDHVNRCPSHIVVKFQCLVVLGEVFARINELDLINLNALLFLQLLFDCQYLMLGFKIERMLASRQSLDENL
jgi:hypothetical protein